MQELTKKGTLGSILSASRIITEDDIQAALAEQARSGCRMGEALIKLGIVSQEDIDWALSNQLDLPYIRLKRENIDPDVIGIIPADMARECVCMPMFVAGDELNIAIADPLNRSAIESIQRHTGLRIGLSMALPSEITDMIDVYYGPVRHDSLGFESALFSGKVLDVINADLTGARLLDGLLITIIKNQLTSLSLQSRGNRVVIRGRRAGICHDMGAFSSGHYEAFVSGLRERCLATPMAGPLSGGGFSFEYRGRSMCFQFAALQTPDGDYITLHPRIPEAVPECLADLELEREQRDNFHFLAKGGRGITFFASHCITERNRAMEIMLEEAGAGDRTVLFLGAGSGWSRGRFPRIPFPELPLERSRAIEAALEHDPDILVIEELDDVLPLRAACRAVMRGVKVLAGLSARGVRDALFHLQCQGRDPLFPMLVSGLVVLKEARRLCPICRTEYTPTAEELATMALERPPVAFYRSEGCDVCGESGVQERRTLMEVLPFNDSLRSLILTPGDTAALDRFLAGNCLGIVREGVKMLGNGDLSPEEYIASIVM